MTPIPALIGSKFVPDIRNPRSEDVDVPFMWRRMREIRRFSGHPKALTLAKHHEMCRGIAVLGDAPDEVAQWASIHDNHEYAIGDITTPLETVLESPHLGDLKKAWDIAICDCLHITYPDGAVRLAVRRIDKIAAAIEWEHLMGQEACEWFPEIPAELDLSQLFHALDLRKAA